MKKFFIFVIIVVLIVIGIILFKVIRKKALNNTDFENSNTSNGVIENAITNVIDNVDNDVNSEAPDDVELTDLFGKYYEQAENLLKSMTLEEKVGQIFLVRFPDSGIENQIKE